MGMSSVLSEEKQEVIALTAGKPFREDAVPAFPGDDISRAKYSDFDKDFRIEARAVLRPLRDVRQPGPSLVRETLKTPHEIARAHRPQDDPHGNWEPPPSGIMPDGWCKELISHPASLMLASPQRPAHSLLIRYAVHR
jgi:hypothetical protein